MYTFKSGNEGITRTWRYDPQTVSEQHCRLGVSRNLPDRDVEDHLDEVQEDRLDLVAVADVGYALAVAAGLGEVADVVVEESAAAAFLSADTRDVAAVAAVAVASPAAAVAGEVVDAPVAGLVVEAV
jgi:hypothetical protein